VCAGDVRKPGVPSCSACRDARAAWLALFVARLFSGRARARDQAVLLFFLINTLYIFLFRRGSSIHLYRVFYFSAFLALAVTDLIAELRGFLARRLGARAANLGAAALCVAYFAVDLPHALHNLLESRVLMGTHAQPGYDPEYHKLLFARAAAERTDPYAFAVFYNLPHRLEFTYYFDRSYGISPWGQLNSLAQVAAVQKLHPNLVLMTTRKVAPSEDRLLRELLQHHEAYAYEGYLLVLLDKEVAQPVLHEYRFVATRPNLIWWWFYSHKYPPMQAVEVKPPPAP